MNKPQINVTPLIDVLLVLLIIFMVVAPLKPSAFKARVPAEPARTDSGTDAKTLVVVVAADGSLALNGETKLGSTTDATALMDCLRRVFDERLINGDVSESFVDARDRPFSDKTERTVFIKAPRDLDYGSVTRVIDAVKQAGAFPISLQIDHLE